MATTFVKLTKRHDVKDFDCGNKDLNYWFATTAGQHQRKGLSVTTVLVDDRSPHEILGFQDDPTTLVLPVADIPDPA